MFTLKKPWTAKIHQNVSVYFTHYLRGQFLSSIPSSRTFVYLDGQFANSDFFSYLEGHIHILFKDIWYVLLKNSLHGHLNQGGMNNSEVLIYFYKQMHCHSHGRRMGFSWDFHRIFRGFLWDSNNILIGFSWDFHGIFMGFLWHGILMIFS